MHAGLRSALFGSALPLAGFDLGMDFRAGWYRSGAVVTRDPLALPGASFVRPGAKFEDVGGSWVPVAAAAPAIVPGVGFLARPAYTNFAPNSQWAGMAVGSNSSPLMSFDLSTRSNGLTLAVVGTGVEGGVPYIDLRFSGTLNNAAAPGQNAFVYPVFSGTTNDTMPSVTAGEIWTAAITARLVAGSLNGVMNRTLNIHYRDANNVIVNGAPAGLNIFNTSDPTIARRVSNTISAAPSNATRLWAHLTFGVADGQSVDATIRLSAPSIVKLPILGPYIPTTNGAATIVDDDLRITGPVPDDGDWVGIVSATLPDAVSSPATPIGLVFIGNPAGGGNYIYVGRQPSGASGGIFATASSGGSNVATVNSNVAHAAGGRHVIAFGRRANRYFILGRNPAGAIGTMVTMPTDQPMPVGLGRIQPGRRDVAGAAINGPLEFLGWRRISPGFTDDQVRGMLVALA